MRAPAPSGNRRGSIEANPFAALPINPTVKRERVLTDAELRAIWQATAKPGSFNSIVRMLMLTAQRRDEVAGMAWPELSEDRSTWTFPASRAKNGDDSIVPLSAQARAIIVAAPRYARNPLSSPATRRFQRLEHIARALDKDMRRHGLGVARFAPDGRDEPPKARRPARGDRSGPESCRREPRRHRRDLPAPRLGRREALRPAGLGRSPRCDRRRPRAGRQRDAAPRRDR